MKRIKHIAIVVKDMEKAIENYRDMFGFEVADTLDAPGGEMKVVMLSCGEVNLELFQPLTDTGSFADFLKETGGGLHHIALTSDDVDGDFQKLKAQGRKLQSDEPLDTPFGKLFFVSTGDEAVSVELMENK